MEKEKVDENNFPDLFSKLVKEKQINASESDMEYENRLSRLTNTDAHIKEEVLQSKENENELLDKRKETMLNECKKEIACIDTIFSSPKMNQSKYKWIGLMIRHGCEISILTICFSTLWLMVEIILYQSPEMLVVGSFNKILEVMMKFVPLVCLPICCILIAREIVKKAVGLNNRYFQKYCEKDLMEYENGSYNVLISSYLFKKYQKRGDEKYNNFLLDELAKNNYIQTKLYKCNNVFFNTKWNVEVERDYINLLINEYKQKNK